MGCCVVSRTFDVDLIKSVMFRPDVFATVAEDGCTEDDLVINVNSECWLKVEADGQLIGVYNYHVINSTTVQIHPAIFPEYRGKLALQSGKLALLWLVENSNYQKVICAIPDIYRNVILFAMQCGLVKEGNNRRSYLKSGKIHDMIWLGITRPEIEELSYEQNWQGDIRRH